MRDRSARFLSTLNWLVPPERHATADEREHAKRVAAFILAMLVWVPVFATVFPAFGAWVSGAIVLAAGAAFAVTLVLLRARTPAVVCGNLLAGSCWCTITGVSLCNGGVVAPSVVWYVAVPVLSLWLSGMRSGLFWTSASVAAIAAFSWAHQRGIDLPDETSDDAHPYVAFACLVGAVCCVFLLVHVVVKMEHRARTLLHQANRRLELLAGLDGLTGLPNRREFDRTFEQEWLRHQRMRLPLSLLLIDVDFFKQFNDHVGHLLGDDCLKSIAQAIASQARRPGDLAARFGGEEFVVILPNIDAQGATLVAENIRIHIKAIAIPHPGSVVAPQVTVSIGTSTAVPASGMSSVDLVNDADEALYRAKSGGRDRTVHIESSRPQILQFVG